MYDPSRRQCSAIVILPGSVVSESKSAHLYSSDALDDVPASPVMSGPWSWSVATDPAVLRPQRSCSVIRNRSHDQHHPRCLDYRFRTTSQPLLFLSLIRTRTDRLLPLHLLTSTRIRTSPVGQSMMSCLSDLQRPRSRPQPA